MISNISIPDTFRPGETGEWLEVGKLIRHGLACLSSAGNLRLEIELQETHLARIISNGLIQGNQWYTCFENLSVKEIKVHSCRDGPEADHVAQLEQALNNIRLEAIALPASTTTYNENSREACGKNGDENSGSTGQSQTTQ